MQVPSVLAFDNLQRLLRLRNKIHVVVAVLLDAYLHVRRLIVVFACYALCCTPDLHVQNQHDESRSIERDDCGVDLVGEVLDHLKP